MVRYRYSLAPRWLPQVEGLRCRIAAIYLGEDTKVIVPGGLQNLQVGVNAPEIIAEWYEVDVDLHTQQVKFLPMSTEGLSIPPVFLFTKDQNKGGK